MQRVIEEDEGEKFVEDNNTFNQMLFKLGLSPVKIYAGPEHRDTLLFWADDERVNMISNDLVDSIIKGTIEISTNKYINLPSELETAAENIQDKYPEAKKVAKELIKQMGM